MKKTINNPVARFMNKVNKNAAHKSAKDYRRKPKHSKKGEDNG